MTVCDCVAETALTGERVYPNNKDLTGTMQLDLDKQTKNMQNQTSKKKKKCLVLGSLKQALGRGSGPTLSVVGHGSGV